MFVCVPTCYMYLWNVTSACSRHYSAALETTEAMRIMAWSLDVWCALLHRPPALKYWGHTVFYGTRSRERDDRRSADKSPKYSNRLLPLPAASSDVGHWLVLPLSSIGDAILQKAIHAGSS